MLSFENNDPPPLYSDSTAISVLKFEMAISKYKKRSKAVKSGNLLMALKQ